MFIDFLIGLFAVNSLPHFLFAKLNSGVLSLFGHGSTANLCYSVLCLVIATTLYLLKYGLSSLDEHMMLFGALFVVVSFYVGWNLVDRFLRVDELPNPRNS